MRSFLVIVAATSCLAISGWSQSAGSSASTAAQAGAATPASSAGMPESASSAASVQAVLNKSLDTKKAKQGDEVTAKTTEDVKAAGGVGIPKNTKLIGHITEVKAFEKGKSQGSLAILFDKAVLKSGQELPIHATIQAVAPPVRVAMPSEMAEPGGPPSGGSPSSANGGMVGETGRTVGSAVGSAANTAGGVASSTGAAAGSAVGSGAQLPANANVALNANSQGTIGLGGIQLSPGASAQGSVLTSGSGNVHLDGGTRMVLRVSTP